ncbi:MAG: aspartate carbamoyltransferase [Candidatus Pacebacteria bacterium]|nr:aspartate carbamoyltransferase [Candidatus Paceibacterota bacterium]
MKHLLSTTEVTKDEVEFILGCALDMEKQCKRGKIKKILEDKIIACIFFEPSTRTRLSFETAALRLGAQVISAEDASSNGSTHKGETTEDTTRIISCYADVMVMRHHEQGASERAAKVSTIPIINAGDGAHEHPTQGLLDLYTIKKEHGRTDNLTIAFVGDLKNSRTLRSLVPLLTLYPKNTFYFVSPKELTLPAEYTKALNDKGIQFVVADTMDEALKNADVLYMTRVQKERFENLDEYERVKDAFLLKLSHVQMMKKDAIVMHPLPRVNEIEHAIDADPRAAYFRQAQNGLYVRMALLACALDL